MPKWGMTIREGTVVEWLVEEGAQIATGDEIVEIETTKITNIFESTAAGVLRRQVAAVGETVPVGDLLGVLADAGVPEAEIDAFVEEFGSSRRAAGEDDAAPAAEFVEAGGHTIRYWREGEAEDGAVPLVLVHGFGGDLETWMFNQPELAQARPVYAFDLPGHGGSSKHVGAGDVAALGTAVGAFLDGAGIERAHLAGHSLGGAAALHLALVAPARVASLTLIAPAALGPEINGAFITGFIEAERRRALKPVLEQLFADPTLVRREMVDDVLRYKRLDGVDGVLRTIAGAAFADGRQACVLADRLEELALPVQVIWGTADRIIPAAHADGLPAAIAVHRLAEVGHMVHMEAASETNRLIGAHIAG